MKLHKSFLIFIQIILISLWLWGVAQAGSNPCNDLIHPLHSQVNIVKDKGGLWASFSQKKTTAGSFRAGVEG
jgi:hypothetical protein